MTSTGEQWWFNPKTRQVEPPGTATPTKDLLGPYASRAEAERALETVRERNKQWDDQD
ncbi:MAG TPA: hypothetical protein VH478_24705 [Trebonia sp.]|jgi:hypothetical protein|nr:hypothetical protein [Trebonia sp.]